METSDLAGDQIITPQFLAGRLSAGSFGGVEPRIDALIVKLASRCNLACDYCYWFRDRTVMAAPKVMTPEVERAFLERLRSHIRRRSLPEFTLIFHGGEPLLFGKRRFAGLCADLRSLEAETASRIRLQVTTNGVLIDDEWAALLRYFTVMTTVSIDGPGSVHDVHRPDLAGRPTLAAVLRGISLLRNVGIEPGILAVADPASCPEEVLAYLVEETRCRSLDFLIPDATHDGAAPASIADWFNRLFDEWYDRYAPAGVEIRLFNAMIRSLCGYSSGVESIGFGPISGVTICTDGALEAHDVVRISGNGSTASKLNLFGNEIDEVRTDPLWRELLHASLNVAAPCRACPWLHACGGGHIASRWSFARRFDNPSVYCRDLQHMLEHIWQRISPTLTIELREAS